jgi:hemerythrin-like domain-containing protein
MKSTSFLIQEHKTILRALDVLDAMTAVIENTGTIEQTDVDKLLDFLRWFADAHHQAKEEAILFPALKRAAAAQERPLEHMSLEHAQERSLVENLEADLRLAKLSEFVSSGNRLSSTLRNHIYKEDKILFETVDSVLSPGEDEAVLERLTQFDTSLDTLVLEEKLKDLRLLEWKYLRR